MEIYLCRHGETEWSLSGQHTSHTDIPLTEKGKQQALLLGKRLASTHFDAVYSSPMQRSSETCRLARFKPILDPDLREWDYGQYEGLKYEEIRKKDPHWNLFLRGAPEGESLEEVSHRADRFLKKIMNKEGKIAVFSHGHFSRVLAVRWLGLEVGSARFFILGVASLSILGRERSQPVIALWNEAPQIA